MMGEFDMTYSGERSSIQERSTGLGDRLLGALCAGVGSVVLIILLTSVYLTVINTSVASLPASVTYVNSGVGLLTVIGLVWWWLDADEQSMAFPLRMPSQTELVWTFVFFPLGIGAFVIGIEIAGGFGFEYVGYDYELTNPATFAGVVFGTLLVAPIVEELLHRGLLLGALVDRGLSLVTAGFMSVVLFGILHLHFGIPGMVAITLWSVFPTILRIRFDNLAGPMLLHFLNNLYAYVLIVLFPALTV